MEELEHGGRVREQLAREPAPRGSVDPRVAALVLRSLLRENGEQLQHGGARQVRHPHEEAVDAALSAERERGERQADLREQLARGRGGAEPPRGQEQRVEELRRQAEPGERGAGALDLPAEHLRGEEEEVGGRGRVRGGQEGGSDRPRLPRPLQREEPLVGGEARRGARVVVERVHGRGQPRLQLRRLRGVHRGDGGWTGGGWIRVRPGGRQGTDGIGPSGTQSRTDEWGNAEFFFAFYFFFYSRICRTAAASRLQHLMSTVLDLAAPSIRGLQI